MSDLLAELDNDFQVSDEEMDSEVEVSAEQPLAERLAPQNTDINQSTDSIIGQIKQLEKASLASSAPNINVNLIQDILIVSEVLSLSRSYLTVIGKDQHYSYDFIVASNELVAQINNTIILIHEFVKTHYNRCFSELETIVPDPIEYVKTILIIGKELHSASKKSGELKKVISGEKILVLNMLTLELPTMGSGLDESRWESIFEACRLVVELNEIKTKMTEFVSNKLVSFAPNLTELVGSYCAVQLMSYCGGLDKLALTPLCNIPSIGSKRPVKIGFGQTGIRQKGYLYISPIVHKVPEHYQKQAMRMVSGKVVLAARMDLAGSIDGSFGKKLHQEVEQKIEKLLAAPENVGPKALPIPEDRKSKKRGGKRVRKMKERYQMTELQKAQNRMEFGKAEDTVMDAYGEEIGLGMAGRNTSVSTSSIRAVQGKDVKWNLSKKMAERLKHLDDRKRENLDDVGGLDQAQNGRDFKRRKVE